MNKLLLLLAAGVVQTVKNSVFGVNVSGGVDSSSVAVVARELGYEFPTFTGYYEGEFFDERPFARLVASRDHHEVLITPDDFVTHFDAMVACLSGPVQGPGTFGQFMVARHISRESDVDLVLSGEGGDELFGGYARLLKVAGWPLPGGYDDSYRPPDGYPATVEEALAYDWERLPDLLRVDDDVLNAHGLMSGAPFLHEPLVKFVLSLPAEMRVGKRLLRDTMRGVVPESILQRTDKKGFPAPFVAWAQDEPVRGFVADRIGYVPDPSKPWDRGWWAELVERSRVAV